MQFRILALCFLCVVPILSGATQANRNSRVGIVSFVAKSGLAPADAEVVEEMFRNGLVQSRKYDVLDRSNMKDVLKEQELQRRFSAGTTSIHMNSSAGTFFVF